MVYQVTSMRCNGSHGLSDMFEQQSRLSHKLPGKYGMCFTSWSVFVYFTSSPRNGEGKSVKAKITRLRILHFFFIRTLIYLTHHSKPKVSSKITSKIRRGRSVNLARTRFCYCLTNLQDEFLDLRNDSVANDVYEEKVFFFFLFFLYHFT